MNFDILKTTSAHFAIFDVERRLIGTPRGVINRDVVLHRNAVALLLIDQDTDEVIITTEYRAGVNEVRTAIPAGLAEENEAPLDTALRELFEETGTTLEDINLLKEFKISSSEGFTSEELSVFVIKARTHRSETRDFDADEYVSSKWIPFSELVNLVDNGTIKSAPAVSAVRTAQVKLGRL